MTTDRDEDADIQCPSCGSTQITAQKAGFGIGKAAAGAVLAGPLGLLAGGIGSRRVVITCLACGQTWRPGHEKDVVSPEWPELARQMLWGLAILGVVGVLAFLFWLVS